MLKTHRDRVRNRIGRESPPAAIDLGVGLHPRSIGMGRDISKEERAKVSGEYLILLREKLAPLSAVITRLG